MDNLDILYEGEYDLLPTPPPASATVPELTPSLPPKKRSRRTKIVANDAIEVQSGGSEPAKKKIRLYPSANRETDPNTGEWVDVRVFDRNAVTVSEAERLEMSALVIPGTYFVSLARKRVRGIVDLHERWLSRMSNRCSEYAAVQHDLQSFFADMLAAFDSRYATYIAHPAFETVGRIRRRTPSPAN